MMDEKERTQESSKSMVLLSSERYETIEKLMTQAGAALIKTIPRGSGAGSCACIRE